MHSFRTYYKSITSQKKGSFETQWSGCLETLIPQQSCAGDKIFKLTIFIDSENEAEFLIRKSWIARSIITAFDACCPAFSILSQAPFGESEISIEAGFIVPGIIHPEYKEFEGIPYVVLKEDGYKEVWVSGIEGSQSAMGTGDGSKIAFEKMHQILEMEGMTFDHIVRQWNYIGEILQKNPCSSGILQNYQTFNEIRHIYYHQYRQKTTFPAATGIGKKYAGVTIDFLAISADSDKSGFAIKSPVQKNPYEYSQEVLVGDGLAVQTAKRAPEFERALLLPGKDFQRLFVSGTASISGEDTVEKENVCLQTETTVGMIRKLIHAENIKKYYPLKNGHLMHPNCIRVYVKNQSDMAKVEKLCLEEYGNAPLCIVQADICRENLLVEIEVELVGELMM
jgi:hypothetical protein